MPKTKIPNELKKYDNPIRWVKENCHPILLKNNLPLYVLIYAVLHPEDSPICKYSGLIKKFSRDMNKFTVCKFNKTCECYEDKIKEINKRRQQTCIDKYGVSNPMLVDEFKAKLDNTNLEKYGCKNPFGNNKVKEKIAKQGQDIQNLNKAPYFK